MFKKNNKRGEFTLLQAATIVGGIMAATLILLIIGRIGSSTGIYATFIAKDSALMIDAAQAIPQSAKLAYSSDYKPKEGSAFLFLTNEFVRIGSWDDKSNSLLAQRMYVPSAFFSPIPSFASKPIFFMIKDGTTYFVSDTPEAIADVEDFADENP